MHEEIKLLLDSQKEFKKDVSDRFDRLQKHIDTKFESLKKEQKEQIEKLDLKIENNKDKILFHNNEISNMKKDINGVGKKLREHLEEEKAESKDMLVTKIRTGILWGAAVFFSTTIIGIIIGLIVKFVIKAGG